MKKFLETVLITVSSFSFAFVPVSFKTDIANSNLFGINVTTPVQSAITPIQSNTVSLTQQNNSFAVKNLNSNLNSANPVSLNSSFAPVYSSNSNYGLISQPNAKSFNIAPSANNFDAFKPVLVTNQPSISVSSINIQPSQSNNLFGAGFQPIQTNSKSNSSKENDARVDCNLEIVSPKAFEAVKTTEPLAIKVKFNCIGNSNNQGGFKLKVYLNNHTDAYQIDYVLSPSLSKNDITIWYPAQGLSILRKEQTMPLHVTLYYNCHAWNNNQCLSFSSKTINAPIAPQYEAEIKENPKINYFQADKTEISQGNNRILLEWDGSDFEKCYAANFEGIAEWNGVLSNSGTKAITLSPQKISEIKKNGKSALRFDLSCRRFNLNDGKEVRDWKYLLVNVK